MKLTPAFLFCCYVFGSLFTHGAHRLPNVVFILADDLGWSDTTLYGTSEYFQTPHVQRLADRGMTLWQAYTASPVCTPTRASILSGQYPARQGLTQARGHQGWEALEATVAKSAPAHRGALEVITANRLPQSVFTLAEALKAAGYATGHFGKWHLGDAPFSPREQGFDVDVPNTVSGGPGRGYLAPWTFENHENLPHAFEGQHIEDKMAAVACAWMEAQADRPFFLNYWSFSIHSPWSAKTEYVDAYAERVDPYSHQRNPVYGGMVQSFDDAVGTLLNKVDALGLSDNTIFVLFSDNGGNTFGPKVTEPAGWHEIPGTTSHPLRGGKGRIWEGGIRVPMVVVWPGVTEPGSTSQALFGSVDFFPTLLSMLGLALYPEHHIDGVDQSHIFRGGESARETLFYYYPHYSDRDSSPSAAIRRGNWKLIKWFYLNPDQSHRIELYNLEQDIFERQDIASRHPEKTQAMLAELEDWLNDTGVAQPQPNPDYLGGVLGE